MLVPDITEFRKAAARGNVIAVYSELLADVDTPVSAFLRLSEAPSFLLESVEGGEKWARFSFLGIRPSMVIKARGNSIETVGADGSKRTAAGDPIDFLRQTMSRFRPVPTPGLPRFFGGLVGYLGYDVVRFVEELPDIKKEALDMPDMFMMLTDTMLIFDNLRQTIKVVSVAYIDGKDPDEAYREAAAKIEALKRDLRRAVEIPSPKGRKQTVGFDSSFGDRGSFEDAVSRAKRYVHSGDVVQVVLSQRFERRCDASPFDVYRALRVINPSPYMYYIDTGDARIVGSSPEILVRLEKDAVTVRPLAGTRKRGKTEAEDKALEEDLRKDPKEVAEHIMLVDLGRNDVGRVAATGSVRVTDLMAVERYSHVMHIVSNVEGRLREGLDCFDVFKACFPAGTVSGAPKVRAMEIIEELEPVHRGPYAGAVGYFSFSGNMDTCITIRTLLLKDGKAYVQAGAGIVADSVPEKEYAESVNKARGMMKAVEMAEESLEVEAQAGSL